MDLNREKEKDMPQWLLTALILLLAACAGGTPSAPAPSTPAAGIDCPSEQCRAPQLDEAARAACAAETARSLEAFQGLRPDSTFEELCAQAGPPDWETGSGLLIYIYELEDGSTLWAGFAGPEHLVYARQVGSNGQATDLLTP
ncbi:MAG: hypothetical protein GYA17_20275 [Chloroflexi bacterium]|nr:hypothetical protein [Anaerolineaceae bacterium]NMB90702.1 hypothetical protein [Chloroflexota bacterium]